MHDSLLPLGGSELRFQPRELLLVKGALPAAVRVDRIEHQTAQRARVERVPRARVARRRGDVPHTDV